MVVKRSQLTNGGLCNMTGLMRPDCETCRTFIPQGGELHFHDCGKPAEYACTITESGRPDRLMCAHNHDDRTKISGYCKEHAVEHAGHEHGMRLSRTRPDVDISRVLSIFQLVVEG